MPVIEPEEGVAVAVEEILILGAIIGEMTADMVGAIIALHSARDEARNRAVSVLDYTHTVRPDTDSAVIAGLEKVIFLLREGGAK